MSPVTLSTSGNQSQYCKSQRATFKTAKPHSRHNTLQTKGTLAPENKISSYPVLNNLLFSSSVQITLKVLVEKWHLFNLLATKQGINNLPSLRLCEEPSNLILGPRYIQAVSSHLPERQPDNCHPYSPIKATFSFTSSNSPTPIKQLIFTRKGKRSGSRKGQTLYRWKTHTCFNHTSPTDVLFHRV